MPATDAALESARSAADLYADTWLARRRAYALLPVDGPDSAAVLGQFRDAARRAFAAFLASLDALREQGDEAEALALVLDVQDRTTAGRTPMEVTVSEEDR
jgi:hypothetical protein